MTNSGPLELSDAELRELEESYEPFRGITDWPVHVRRPDLWAETWDSLDRTREEATPDDLKRALEFVMRAAAIDTGAIEGLYEVDRGFTITVAAQHAAWQAALEGRGETVREFFEAQLRAYELVLDVATKHQPVTEVWIRRFSRVHTN